MDARQISLVRESFAVIEAQAVRAGARFYDELLARDASLSLRLYAGTDTQSRRLLELVGDAVRLLNHPEQLDGVLAMLRLRYLRGGVPATHCDAVGAALLDTLAALLAGDLTPELRAAWGAFHERVCRVLRRQPPRSPRATARSIAQSWPGMGVGVPLAMPA